MCPLQPLPPSPYQPRLTKCRAPSLGSLTSTRPAPSPTSTIPAIPPHTVQMFPSHSETLPDSSLAHLSSFLQLCDSLRTSWCFPPNSSLLQTPQLSCSHFFSLPSTWQAPSPRFLTLPTSLGLFSPPSQQPPPQTRSGFSLHSHFVASPHNSSPALLWSPPSPGPAAAPPTYLGERGGASSPGGHRAAVQRLLAAREASAVQMGTPLS